MVNMLKQKKPLICRKKTSARLFGQGAQHAHQDFRWDLRRGSQDVQDVRLEYLANACFSREIFKGVQDVQDAHRFSKTDSNPGSRMAEPVLDSFEDLEKRYS